MQASLLFEIKGTILSASFHKQITKHVHQTEAISETSFLPPILPCLFQVILPHYSAQSSCSSLSYLVQLTEQGVSESLPSFNPTLTLE